MLAVEPMDPGRTWDLLSANSSMMGNAKVSESAINTAPNALPMLWHSCDDAVSTHHHGGRTQPLCMT